MRPVIGITTHLSDDERTMQLGRTYTDVMLHMGALPMMLPATTDAQVIAQYAHQIDGLLLSGGGDVDPQLFGETTDWVCGAISPLRDDFEMKLCAELLHTSSKPILGICRGFQVLNVALGGTLYQDIQSGVKVKTLSHRQKQRAIYASHSVAITPDTKLRDIVQSDTVMVNSLHHQAVHVIAEGFAVSATAPDGIVEAAELTGHPFCIGVQWHPEQLWNQPGGQVHELLFRAFAEACR